MRCVDVTEKLSNWSGPCDDPAVTDHLARCPRCAAWAERDARLGRLWEATRPAEPSADEWDGVWGRISDALDRAEPVALPLKRSGRARHALWIAVGVAQAAAVLLAVLYFQGSPRGEAPRVVQHHQPAVAQPQPSTPAEPEVEIDPGALVLIRETKGHVETVELALNAGVGQVDPAYETLNALEAIAQ